MAKRATTTKALAVRHAASKDESRYHLNVVRVEPGGTYVATDGHMLLVATGDALGPQIDAPETYDREQVEVALKVAKATKSPLVALERSEHPAHDPSQFPNWRAVIGGDPLNGGKCEGEPVARVRLDGRMLERVIKAAAEFGERRPKDSVYLTFELFQDAVDPTSPVRITAEDSVCKPIGLVGYVMPVRS